MLTTKVRQGREVMEDEDPASLQLPEGEVIGEVLGDVQVIYGAAIQAVPLEGLRVSQAREITETVLKVEHRAPALLNGEPAREAQIIIAGDTLEFVHHAGEKGSVHGCPDRDCR